MEPAPQRPHELRLDLPAAHSAVRMARSFLREFARREGVATKEIQTIEFVASELLSNAVDHGGGGHAMEESEHDGRVRMSLELFVRRDGWTLAVGDQGGGDPDALRARIANAVEPDAEDERGRGLFLMTQMVDVLEVRRSVDGLGLELRAIRTYPRTR